MKRTILLALALAASFDLGAAGEFETAGPPLAAVLARGHEAHKPVLLDFGAVWCGPCKRLAQEFDKPENHKLLDGFVVQVYDAERGEGAAAAARYDVVGYPTLLVVDDKGALLVRQVGLESERVTDWLRSTAEAMRADADLEARLRAAPDDVGTMWLLAKRAQSKGDEKSMRAWLGRIEAADRRADKREAAAAAWMRVESEVTEKLRQDARAAIDDYVRRYPQYGDSAVEAMAAVGVDRATLEAALVKVAEAATPETNLQGLIYLALGVGALDAALRVAERQVALAPDDAFALDQLAEVHNFRGEKEQALAAERQALASKSASPQLVAALRPNLARLEQGVRDPDIKPPSPSRPLASVPRPGVPTPERAAQRLLDEHLPQIAADCGAKIRSRADVYVRVQVGAKAVERVEVLEPAAPAAFKKCVEKALRAVAVPPDAKAARVVLVMKLP